MIIFTLVIGVLMCDFAKGSPNHDMIRRLTSIHRAPQWYSGSANDSNGAVGGTGGSDATTHVVFQRRLAEATSCEAAMAGSPGWGPLRIGTEFADLDETLGFPADSAFRQYLEDVLVPEAVAFWERALKVRILAAPLLAPRSLGNCSCADDQGCFCSVEEVTMCGPDGLVIPERYLAAAEICSTYDKCMSLPDGEGALDKDIILFITANETNVCSTGTIAYATACAEDQCDRPVFGYMNVCPSSFEAVVAENAASRWVHSTQLASVIHEIAHVLGFDSDSFPKFRTSDGTPRIPRKSDNDSDVAPFEDAVWWACDYESNEVSLWDNYDEGDRVFVDPVSVIEVVSARGIDNCTCPLGKAKGTEPGANCLENDVGGLQAPSCVYMMVTPKVVEKAKAHFDCPSLVGAELENQPTNKCSMYGSHWEQRVFMNDIMASTSVLGQVEQVVSEVTLAVFEDSGWYLPDYSVSTPMEKGRDWGYAQGCAFVMNKCVEDGVSPFPDAFCTDEDSTQCSADLSGTVGCTLEMPAAEPPEFLRYFAPNWTIGPLAQPDYCPIHSTIYTNRICTDDRNATFLPYADQNYMRESFGNTSRCHMGNIRGDIEVAVGDRLEADDENMAALLGLEFDRATAQCFATSCDAKGESYDVLLASVDGNGRSVGTTLLGTCSAYGQRLTAHAPLKGSLTCQSPHRVCIGPRGFMQQGRTGKETFTVSTTEAVGVSTSLASSVSASASLSKPSLFTRFSSSEVVSLSSTAVSAGTSISVGVASTESKASKVQEPSPDSRVFVFTASVSAAAPMEKMVLIAFTVLASLSSHAQDFT